MGQEEEGWMEKRLREEQKALEEGKGYSGLIMDQIWEVWNWGKPKEEPEKEKPVTAEAQDKVDRKS